MAMKYLDITGVGIEFDTKPIDNDNILDSQMCQHFRQIISGQYKMG